MTSHIVNMIKVAHAVLLANLFNKKTPLNVMWRITNKCNARCKYCNVLSETYTDPTTEQILNAINQMVKSGTRRIGFVGGEPLIRKDIGSILEHSHKKGIYVTVVSNGYLVPKRMKLLRYINSLIISFDGREYAHDRNREHGSHQKVLKALEIAPKHCNVLTHTVISKYNLGSVDYILDLSRELGFKPIFCPLHDNPDMAPSNEEYQNLFANLLKKKKEGYKIAMSTPALKYFLHWDGFSSFNHVKIPKPAPKCWAGKLYCDVDIDGRMSPCCNIIDRNSLNIYKDGFKKTFDNIKSPNCKSCASFANLVEYNFMYSMNPITLWEWFKIISSR